MHSTYIVTSFCFPFGQLCFFPMPYFMVLVSVLGPLRQLHAIRRRNDPWVRFQAPVPVLLAAAF